MFISMKFRGRPRTVYNFDSPFDKELFRKDFERELSRWENQKVDYNWLDYIDINPTSESTYDFCRGKSYD